MLPGLGFSEIVVLAVLALLVVGPKDLPLMLRKLGQWTRKLQALAQEFRAGFDELARQAELDELRKEVDALRRGNPLSQVNEEIEALRRSVIHPAGDDAHPTHPIHDPAAAAPDADAPDADAPDAVAPDAGARGPDERGSDERGSDERVEETQAVGEAARERRLGEVHDAGGAPSPALSPEQPAPAAARS